MEPLYALAMSMFKDALDAYVKEDVALAMATIPRDEELDEMNATVQGQLIERMSEDPDQLRGYLNLIFIARCMERVGDHRHQHRRRRGLRGGGGRHPSPALRGSWLDWFARA